MNRLVALALTLALAAPAVALPTPQGASPNQATPPAEDARCDTCDALELLHEGDYQRARHVLGLRAAKGDVYAITPLGMIYQHGWGVPVDYDRAMGFYRAAAHAGDVAALNQIGFMVLHGLGRTADPKAAWCWFEQAARGGYEKSTLHLAELMAGGMQPVSCKPLGAKHTDAADLQQEQGGVSATALELWNGVREGMTPDQVASVLPAPYSGAFPPAAQSGDHPNSDVLVAPAVLIGQPAIARVTFVDHAAKVVSLTIDLQSHDPDQNLGLAHALAGRFDAAYGRSLQRTDQGGAVSGAWRRGDRAVQLNYVPLPDRPPVFYVVFTGKGSLNVPSAQR